MCLSDAENQMAWDYAVTRNQLTSAQRELIELLAEEAAEVVHIAMKMLRHGPASFHPLDPARTSNHVLLTREIGDVLASIALLEHYSVTAPYQTERENRFDACTAKLRRVEKYLHHAHVPDYLKE